MFALCSQNGMSSLCFYLQLRVNEHIEERLRYVSLIASRNLEGCRPFRNT